MTKLAINGGTPVFTGSFPSWPYWNDEEKQNLLRALEAGQWGTLGAEALTFAGEFAQYIGTRYAVCVNTGTQALEMMLRGCEIGYGDDVITTPYTFSATVSSIAWCGAMPVMADVDPDTSNIDPASLEDCLTNRTKAILLVHVAGRPCDMDAVCEFARKKGILVLEDSAHAHGSEWKGRKCGSLGDASAFSFQGSKAITGGEGGCVTTDNEKIYDKVWEYHNSGRAKDGSTVMGTNARMAEWEASVLRAQLKRLQDQCLLRQKNADLVSARIEGLPGITLPRKDPRITLWNGYMYAFRARNRDKFVEALNAEGIPCSKGYPSLEDMGMLREAYFEKHTGRKFRGAVRKDGISLLVKEAVWIPAPILMGGDEETEKIAEAIEKVARALC